MGQSEILKLLEKKKTWMNCTEICKALDQGRSAVSSALKKLTKQRFIESEVREEISNHTKYVHRYNITYWRAKE
jgi:predicted transcriptional regulator